jgi:NAD(P)-dependent dehydrogenase (short-subunit alcohol dehydrogenase family)
MKKIKEYYFITGASKGIGKAFLELLIKNGCFALVLVRNKKDMIQYKNNKNVIIFEGDVCNNNIIKKVFDYVDKKKINIKYLINNAGQRQRKKFLRISSKDIKNIFDINYFSVFNITQKFADHMKYKKYNASVVNISSIVGHLGFNELSGYGSTKAALNGLTKCLASEFNGKIRFNSINPGFTKTSFYENFKVNQKKLYKWTLSRIPMKRWGKPIEIAELIYFLCSDKSSYINGEIINIDGGWSNT